MVSGEREYVFLSSRDEKNVSFVGKLLEAENVIFLFLSSVEKT